MIHESNEKKAIADRIREADVQAKKQWFEENKNTLLAFEEQTRDIIGALSKKAVNTFPCLHRKRKNKPRRRPWPSPPAAAAWCVHGHPGQALQDDLMDLRRALGARARRVNVVALLVCGRGS